MSWEYKEFSECYLSFGFFIQMWLELRKCTLKSSRTLIMLTPRSQNLKKQLKFLGENSEEIWKDMFFKRWYWVLVIEMCNLLISENTRPLTCSPLPQMLLHSPSGIQSSRAQSTGHGSQLQATCWVLRSRRLQLSSETVHCLATKWLLQLESIKLYFKISKRIFRILETRNALRLCSSALRKNG